ncbi:hypothetical protein LTR64_001751 [Lithohypha guttulata]|uniref:uncharacterized protein n=1 Tax=Lithohypha guttulata TaxID=1690604 RepID=UPI002DDE8F67|nr:hypothetical protein LTR51_003945 [Lithohypha guttulata]
MLVELEEQLKAIKKAEETRNSLVESLIAKVRELYVERGELQSKLEQAEDLRDVYHDKLKHARNDFNELERKMFCDGYIKRGSLGGREAAIHLTGNLTRLLKAQENFQPHLKLIVRLYASMSKLGEAYVKSSVLADVSVWQDFVQAFNKEIPLCEFIDAGSDRESADTRIKGNDTLV